MEVTHQADVKKAAIQFLRQRQEQFVKHTGDSPLVVALHVRPDKLAYLLTHERFRQDDTVDLHARAKAYVKGRLPVVSREVAIALLLSCVNAGHELPELGTDVLKIASGRKFR
jgi:hypothetical protein